MSARSILGHLSSTSRLVTRRSSAWVIAMIGIISVFNIFPPGASSESLPTLNRASTTVTWTIARSTLLFAKIVCPTSQICDAIGSDDRVARSSDGGQQWSDPALKVRIVSTLDISCPSPEVCVVSADAGILGQSPQPPRFLVSHDGNRVWKLIAPPNDVTGLGPVSCPDSRHCLALATTA